MKQRPFNNQYLKTMFQSFYSASVYKDAIRNFRGYGIRYLFIVSLVTSLLLLPLWAINIRSIDTEKTADEITSIILSDPNLTFEENINRFLNILHQVPKITIENGKASSDADQPYEILDPTTQAPIAIIDLSGATTSLDNTKAVFLLTKTDIIMRDSSTDDAVQSTISLQDLSNLDENSINKTFSILSQIPPLTLEKGKFKTEDDKLYTIHGDNGKELVQIGPDATLDESKAEPLMAINEDEITYKSMFNKNIATIKASELNEQNLVELIQSVISTVKILMLAGVPLVALPFILLTSFGLSVFMLCLSTLISYFFIKTMHAGNFELQHVTRFTAVAITPVIILSTLLPQITPSQDFIYFLISVGYIYYAVKSIAR